MTAEADYRRWRLEEHAPLLRVGSVVALGLVLIFMLILDEALSGVAPGPRGPIFALGLACGVTFASTFGPGRRWMWACLLGTAVILTVRNGAFAVTLPDPPTEFMVGQLIAGVFFVLFAPSVASAVGLLCVLFLGPIGWAWAAEPTLLDPHLAPVWIAGGLALLAWTTVIEGMRRYAFAQIVQARQLADVDPLTGLPTRGAFVTAARGRLKAAREAGQPAALVFLDADHFKRINDTLGHDAGDVALQRIAHALAEAVRDRDLVGRLGGEEFAVLLGGVDAAEARALAERVRAQACHPGPPVVTVSAGVAVSTNPTLQDLLHRADAALYRAKANGRDRVEVA